MIAPTASDVSDFLENVTDGVAAFLAVVFFITIIAAVISLIRRIFRGRKRQ